MEYTISSDVIAGSVATQKLHDEIVASSIATELNGVRVSGDALEITFAAALSAADKTTLDNDTTGPSGGLVGNHDGIPYPDVTSDGYVNSSSDQGRTATTYAQKTSLTFESGGGPINVWWSAEIMSTDSGTHIKTRIQLDDTTNLGEVDPNPDTNTSTGWGSFAGVARITPARGNHHLDIDWASTVEGKDVRIRNATILIRVV